MITIGIGNTGMLLATMFDDEPILLSTAIQDTANFSEYKVLTFYEKGSSKRFNFGLKIWSRNIELLRDKLVYIENDNIIIFSSLGGGSGSSSLQIVSKILLENNNHVLVVAVLPYKKEINPPLANAVQALNNLMPIINKISVLLFDNEKLRKIFNSDWRKIDEYIVRRVDYMVNLLRKYSRDDFSPLTIDQSELDSVIFGSGFIDFSDTFLEEATPKFEYGNLDKNTKNCLLAMIVDKEVEDMYTYQQIFTSVIDKISAKVKNARLIPGIIRAKINHTNSINGVSDRAYIIIASGLNINKYIKKIEKIRDVAIEKARLYMEVQDQNKFIERKENKILDI